MKCEHLKETNKIMSWIRVEGLTDCLKVKNQQRQGLKIMKKYNNKVSWTNKNRQILKL